MVLVRQNVSSPVLALFSHTFSLLLIPLYSVDLLAQNQLTEDLC